MASSIAGLIWQAVSLIPECRRGAVPSGSIEGVFPGRYPQTNGRGELRIWELTCLPTTTRERTHLRLGPRRRPR